MGQLESSNVLLDSSSKIGLKLNKTATSPAGELKSDLVEAPWPWTLPKKGRTAGDNNYGREIVMRPESGAMQRHTHRTTTWIESVSRTKNV